MQTPVLDGLAHSRDLPDACSMDGRCAEVCPVVIPLRTLLRPRRRRSWREGLEPNSVRAGIGFWAMLARRPALYRVVSRGGVRPWAAGAAGVDQEAALARGWSSYRDMRLPPGRTFMEQYRAERARRKVGE